MLASNDVVMCRNELQKNVSVYSSLQQSYNQQSSQYGNGCTYLCRQLYLYLCVVLPQFVTEGTEQSSVKPVVEYCVVCGDKASGK